jgi:hypothetical protein
VKLTLQKLKQQEWRFYYGLSTTQIELKYYVCDACPGLVSVHATRKGRTDIRYCLESGASTSSPEQAIHLYNRSVGQREDSSDPASA